MLLVGAAILGAARGWEPPENAVQWFETRVIQCSIGYSKCIVFAALPVLSEVEPLNDRAEYRDALKKNYNFGMRIGRVITRRTV